FMQISSDLREFSPVFFFFCAEKYSFKISVTGERCAPLRAWRNLLLRRRITRPKSSLREGVELAARCAGSRQAERRRSVSEAD
ncbi:hypothetical protein, partial [Hominenteromicrobium sp.]|uniref:hypothetical protein n=1 Tax=Hominenteromicrobium sp. TaxID=3073581 RepID=UPI003A913E71